MSIQDPQTTSEKAQSLYSYVTFVSCQAVNRPRAWSEIRGRVRAGHHEVAERGMAKLFAAH